MRAFTIAIVALMPALGFAQQPTLTQDDWSAYVLDDTESHFYDFRTLFGSSERRSDSIAVLRAFAAYHEAKALEEKLIRASQDSGYARSLQITPPSPGTLYFYHTQTDYTWQLLKRLDAVFREKWILR